MTFQTDNGPGRRPALVAAIAAGLVCLLLYLRTLGNDFIYIDDPAYVYNNPQIRSLDWRGLASAFSGLFAGDYWMPLTWISFAVDYHFWALNPLGYHLTNSLLHAVNTALVVLVADRLIIPIPGHGEQRTKLRPVILAAAALLWGLHPLRVESVAWIAERKDVLNGMFVLGSLLAYLVYAGRRGTGVNSARFYLASLALFACSLLSKPSSVVLPLVLVIIDRYPLERLNRATAGRLLLEKVPFVALSVALTVITIAAKLNYNGLRTMTEIPFSVRLVLSGNAVFEYVRMSLWPVGIIPFYPLPKPVPLSFIIHTLLVAAVSCVILLRARRQAALCAAWFSFVILLLPVLSFVHNGFDIALAPRFTYLPSIALCLLAAAALAAAQTRFSAWGARTVTLLLLAALLVCGMGITVRLISSWRDTESLWSRQINILPLGRAFNARGHYYLIRERYAEAVRDFSTALGIAQRAGMPFVDNILAFRGEALRLSGNLEAAVGDFSDAIAANPHPRYFYHRGLALQALGRSTEAQADFRRSGGDTGRIIWFDGGEE